MDDAKLRELTLAQYMGYCGVLFSTTPLEHLEGLGTLSKHEFTAYMVEVYWLPANGYEHA